MTRAQDAPSKQPALREASRVTAGGLLILAVIGAAAALLVGYLCSRIGQYEGSTDTARNAILEFRISRLAVAAVVGAALAAAGMALQGMLRNPLAEPYILGISSGAGVGVLAGPMLAASAGFSSYATTPVMALIGALLTCLLVYGIAQRRGRLDPYVLLLSGVIVSVFNSALMMAIMLVLQRNDVLEFISWGMGGIHDSTNKSLLALCATCVAAGWVVLFLRGAAFNTLGLGDEVAASSGVPIHWLRLETFAVVGLMTAAAVALAGPIGFVGLIVPHICRLIVGADHRRLVLVSGFAGAILLMIADTVGRTAGPMIGVATIPVGVITAMAGGPFFIFLLRKRFKEGLR